MKASARKAATPRRWSASRGNERRLVTQHPRRRILSLAAGAAVLPAVTRMAWAQAYPTRPVHLVVGALPGGPSDIVARLMGQWLSERLGQQFIVENRPGAGSNIGTDAVAKAAPDGYTLLLATAANASNATLYDKLNFNFIRDIAPVASIARAPYVLQVNLSVPVKTVPEFIAYVKANPDHLNMASSGIGTADHLSGELFKMMTGVNMIHVPYRSAAPVLTDLLTGQIQVWFGSVLASIEYFRAGKLRALAVTTAARSEVLPDVPALSDFVPGFETSLWHGVGVPRNTPIEIVAKLNREINAALADPKIKARFTELGGTVLAGSPTDFGKLIAEETEKWGKVIRAANIKLQ
jgi:tripartite-type tricarboxylate transporter receptor subunit TctC